MATICPGSSTNTLPLDILVFYTEHGNYLYQPLILEVAHTELGSGIVVARGKMVNFPLTMEKIVGRGDKIRHKTHTWEIRTSCRPAQGSHSHC